MHSLAVMTQHINSSYPGSCHAFVIVTLSWHMSECNNCTVSNGYILFFRLDTTDFQINSFIQHMSKYLKINLKWGKFIISNSDGLYEDSVLCKIPKTVQISHWWKPEIMTDCLIQMKLNVKDFF